MIFFEIIALLRDGPSVTAPHVGLENAPFQKRYIYDHKECEVFYKLYKAALEVMRALNARLRQAWR